MNTLVELLLETGYEVCIATSRILRIGKIRFAWKFPRTFKGNK